MRNAFKHIAAAALAVVMAVNIGAATASAAEEKALENGTYEGSIHFFKEGTTEFVAKNYSMCDALFVHKADVTVTNENVKIDAFVAFPVPAFPNLGKDGTLKNVVLTHGEKKYEAVSDINTKTVKTFDTANALFGIKKGDELSTQKLTFTLPRDAAAQLEKGFATTAYVNVFMNNNVNFVVQVANLTPTSGSGSGSESKPTEQSEKAMTVTAEVAAPAATYTVTIPESVTLGTLSATNDTVHEYQVKVTAANMGNGYVEVSTAADGKLTNGKNELSFANSFGTQKTSADATFTGNFTVSADAVKTAAAGNYTGTANFTVRYFAGK